MLLRNKASNRCSEIPESNYRDRRSSGCPVQAGQYETHRQRRLWLYARPIPAAGQATGTLSQLEGLFKIKTRRGDPNPTASAAARRLRTG
jgi:hypothetical protein